MSGEVPESEGGEPPTTPESAVEFPKAAARVFISYASQDAAVAERLCAALEAGASGILCDSGLS
jgi:hypothetical protein